MQNGIDGGLGLVPKENHSTKVVDLPGKKGEKLNSEADYRSLVERVKQHKVDLTGKDGKLIRKEP
jgi:hypothetical protein